MSARVICRTKVRMLIGRGAPAVSKARRADSANCLDDAGALLLQPLLGLRALVRGHRARRQHEGQSTRYQHGQDQEERDESES